MLKFQVKITTRKADERDRLAPTNILVTSKFAVIKNPCRGEQTNAYSPVFIWLILQNGRLLIAPTSFYVLMDLQEQHFLGCYNRPYRDFYK
jgi:hypothetical protein